MADKIPMEAVESSNIARLGYDAHKLILAIEFKAGSIYHLAGFEQFAWNELQAAASKGKAIAAILKSKRYEGDKMTGHCADCGALGWAGDRCEDCGCSDIAKDPYTPKGEKHGDKARA